MPDQINSALLLSRTAVSTSDQTRLQLNESTPMALAMKITNRHGAKHHPTTI
jgi:hypothetical protein